MEELLLGALLEIRLDDCTEAIEEGADELGTDDAAVPQMPATAFPPTVNESILAISCEPVARNRSWFAPAIKLIFLVTVLHVDSDAVRGNDKLPDEPFTVNPALVDPTFA
jgi:hypothetical protein